MEQPTQGPGTAGEDAADAGIPVVDLRDYLSPDPDLQVDFIQTLGAALRQTGFVRVTGHNVGPAVVEPAYESARQFFALDEPTKRMYVVPGGAGERAFTPFGVEHARDQDKPDLKEFWHTGRELPPAHPLYRSYPPNHWPLELAGFRSNMLALYRSLEQCAMVLLEAIAEYLEQPGDTFTDLVRDGNTILRALHYPPLSKARALPGAVRAAAHEDINFITLLVSSTASGLELQRRDGSWMAVDAEPGEIIADVGDMMSRVTNGLLPSTTHRVVNPTDANTSRLSLPFFVHPRPDAMLEVLPNCVGPDFPEPPAAITGYDFLLERLRELGLAT